MKREKLAINFGSKYLAAGVKGGSSMVQVPALAVLDPRTEEILAFGIEAQKMLTESTAPLIPVYPFAEGVVCNETVAAAFVCFLLECFALTASEIHNLTICCVVNNSMSGGEKRALESLFFVHKVRQVEFLENAVCVMRGFQPPAEKSGIFVDIGGAIADFGVVIDGKMADGCTLYAAGDYLAAEIKGVLHKRFEISISGEEAENLKRQVSLFEESNYACVVQGIGAGGQLERVDISSLLFYDEVEAVANKWCEVIATLGKSLPPELFAKAGKQIYLCGGTSCWTGLKEFLSDRLHIPVLVDEMPFQTALRGALK